MVTNLVGAKVDTQLFKGAFVVAVWAAGENLLVAVKTPDGIRVINAVEIVRVSHFHSLEGK